MRLPRHTMTGQLARVANFNVVEPSSTAAVGETSIPPSTMSRASVLAAASTSSMGSEVAVVVTAPLTTNEDWTAFQSGEMRVFVDGECLAE